MKGKVRLLGKSFPAWIVAAAIIVGTAGAATGVVLAGKVTGEFTVTSSQALVIDTSGSSLTGVDRGLFTRSDDGTRFTAGAEVNTGDAYQVRLALANESAVELTGELTLFGPDGITLSVSPNGAIVDQDLDLTPDALVQTGPFSWKFRMNAAALGNANGLPELTVTVALADDLPPGFYAIDGTIKQVAQ